MSARHKSKKKPGGVSAIRVMVQTKKLSPKAFWKFVATLPRMV